MAQNPATTAESLFTEWQSTTSADALFQEYLAADAATPRTYTSEGATARVSEGPIPNREEFFVTRGPPPSTGELVERGAKMAGVEFSRGVSETLGSALKGPEALVGARDDIVTWMLTKMGLPADEVEKAARPVRFTAESLLSRAGGVLQEGARMLPEDLEAQHYIPGGRLGAQTARAGGSAAVFVPAAFAGGPAAASGLGVLAGAGSMRDEALAAGVGPGQRAAATLGGAAVGGLEGLLGAEQAIAALGTALRGAGKDISGRAMERIVLGMVTSGAGESIEEAAQGSLEEMIRVAALNTAVKRSLMGWLTTFGEVWLDQGLPAGIIGAILGGTGAVGEVMMAQPGQAAPPLNEQLGVAPPPIAQAAFEAAEEAPPAQPSQEPAISSTAEQPPVVEPEAPPQAPAQAGGILSATAPRTAKERLMAPPDTLADTEADATVATTAVEAGSVGRAAGQTTASAADVTAAERSPSTVLSEGVTPTEGTKNREHQESAERPATETAEVVGVPAEFVEMSPPVAPGQETSNVEEPVAAGEDVWSPKRLPTRARTSPGPDLITGEAKPPQIGGSLTGNLVAPSERVDPTSAPDVITALAKIVTASGGKTPIRWGRLGRRDALGVFKVRPEVIRVQTANDIATAAHEVGHALEKHVYGVAQGGVWKNPLASKTMQRELAALGKALYGDRKPAGGYKSEGFAEYVRLYVSDPAALSEKAPTFHAWFENTFLVENPEVAGAFAESRAAATRWREQGSVARARETVVDPAKGRNVKALREKLRPARIFTAMVESGAPTLEAQQAALQAEPGLEAEILPFNTFDARRLTHDAKVAYMVERGMIDLHSNVVGPALMDIRPLISGRYKDFLIYLLAKRTVALAPTGRSSGLSVEDAKQVLKELDSPKFQLAASKLYEWHDGVLNYVAQASPYYARAVEKIRAVDPGNYIPLQREMDEIAQRYAGVRGSGSPLQRLRGSGRRVKDPLQTSLARARRMVLAAHQRMVLDQVIALRDVDGMGRFVEEIPVDKVPSVKQTLADVLEKVEREIDPLGLGVESIDELRSQFADLLDNSMTEFVDKAKPDTKDAIVPYWDGKRMRWFQVKPELYGALSTMEVYRLPGVVGAIAGGTTRAFRAGTTGLRAAFGMVRNPIRDFQTLYLNSRARKNGAELFASWMRFQAIGLVDALSGGKLSSEWFQLVDRLGVSMATPLGQDTAHTARAARRLSQGVMARTIDPRNWLDWYRDVVQFGETATRATEIKAIADAYGWKPGMPMSAELALDLTLAGKKVTTDFSAAGDVARVANQLVPFFNSQIQGPRAMIQAAKEHPGRFMFRGLQIAAATLGLWWLNKDEDWYEEIPDEEKFAYWHFELPVGDKTEIVRVPRAYEGGALFASLPELFADAWYREDPETATAWFQQFFNTITPDITPQAAKPSIEWLANWDMFRKRPIVPRGQLDAPPEEQIGPYTSELAKWAGGALGLSPRKIDQWVASTFGPVAMDVIQATGLGSEKASAKEGLADAPVIGTLFRSGGERISRPKSVERLYDRYEESLKRQHSKKNPETPAERDARLMIEDAIKAVSALSFLRWELESDEQRGVAYTRMLEIARDANRRLESGEVHPKQFERDRRLAEREREKFERSKEPVSAASR